MTNKKIKTAIIGNIALLAFSVILLVTMSFAWFTLSVESKAGQTINIGTFVVNLNDDKTGTKPATSSSIAITAGYPMTRTEALKAENITANKNKYTFQIENKGSIAAMLKLTTTKTDVKNPNYEGATPAVPRPAEFIPIAEQMRYTIRMYTTAGDTAVPFPEVKHDTTSTTKATSFLYDGTGSNANAANVAATNTSLDEYLRGMLLKADATDATHYTAKSADTTLNGGASFYFDIVIWLDETATVQSTNSNNAAGFSEGFTFNLKMEAMQAQGGAFFTIA